MAIAFLLCEIVELFGKILLRTCTVEYARVACVKVELILPALKVETCSTRVCLSVIGCVVCTGLAVCSRLLEASCSIGTAYCVSLDSACLEGGQEADHGVSFMGGLRLLPPISLLSSCSRLVCFPFLIKLHDITSPADLSSLG